jgi:hypothetical protein
MSDLKDAIKLILGLIAVAGAIWAYLHLLAFLKERGIRLGRYDPSHEPAKVEIQTPLPRKHKRRRSDLGWRGDYTQSPDRRVNERYRDVTPVRT